MDITIVNKQVLSDNWYHLYKYEYEYTDRNGVKQVAAREAYDRGNGAAVLMVNQKAGKVMLTRQFRLPTYVNGNADGMMIEACAGLLDDENAEACIIREIAEETGYNIKSVHKVMEAYMSPGSVTEILHLFITEYDESMKQDDGGGLASEHEEIEVLEFTFSEIKNELKRGSIIDAKTIMLIQHAIIEGIIT